MMISAPPILYATAPLATDCATVEPIWRDLAARAAALGLMQGVTGPALPAGCAPHRPADVVGSGSRLQAGPHLAVAELPQAIAA